MTSQEEKQITEWADTLSNDIQIRLVLTEDKRSTQFSEFCDYLSGLAPKIRIIREQGEANDIPAIRISESLRYHAVPLGTELDPFLEALAGLDKSGQIPDFVRDHADKIRAPAELKLYVTQHCPFCPTAVRQLLPLASAAEFIRLVITDGFLFPEMAESDNIQSAPTLLLEDQFRWTGTINIREVLEVIENRDPSRLSASSMESMLKEGNVSLLTKMMLDREVIFPGFFDLLVHEKWPVRLGAMVAMEEIAEQNREMAAQVIKPLWDRFYKVDDQIKGDIIYIFGEAGNNELISELEKISEGPYSGEIKEAARESLEKIRNKDKISSPFEASQPQS